MVHNVVDGAEVLEGAGVDPVEGEVVAVGAPVVVVEFEAGVAELPQAARPSAMATEASPRTRDRRAFSRGEPWPDGRPLIVFIGSPFLVWVQLFAPSGPFAWPPVSYSYRVGRAATGCAVLGRGPA
jgi:hypothetical protein